MLPDPYDPQQLNRYAYVRNNPVKFVDPSGNFGITVSIIAGTAIVGAGILVYPTVKDFVTTAITDMYEGSVEASSHINDIQKQTEKTLINTGLILGAKALINQMFDQSLTPSTHMASDSRKLGKNLEAAGQVRFLGAHAHHIVGSGTPYSSETRAILEAYGIGINDAVNGVFLPGSATVAEKLDSCATPHPCTYVRDYYQTVHDRIDGLSSREAIEEELTKIGSELSEGTFDIVD